MNNKEYKAVLNNSCKIDSGFKRQAIDFGCVKISWKDAQDHLAAWVENEGGRWSDACQWLSQEIDFFDFEEIKGFNGMKSYVITSYDPYSKYDRYHALNCAAYVVSQLVEPKWIEVKD